jgi:hypothetical protein
MPQATHSKQIDEFSEFVLVMMATAVSHDALNEYSKVRILNACSNHEDCSDMSHDVMLLILPEQRSILRSKSILCLYHPL